MLSFLGDCLRGICTERDRAVHVKIGHHINIQICESCAKQINQEKFIRALSEVVSQKEPSS